MGKEVDEEKRGGKMTCPLCNGTKEVWGVRMDGKVKSEDCPKCLGAQLRDADRLADYVRMHFEINPPMPLTIAIAWRDYQEGRK